MIRAIDQRVDRNNALSFCKILLSVVSLTLTRPFHELADWLVDRSKAQIKAAYYEIYRQGFL